MNRDFPINDPHDNHDDYPDVIPFVNPKILCDSWTADNPNKAVPNHGTIAIFNQAEADLQARKRANGKRLTAPLRGFNSDTLFLATRNERNPQRVAKIYPYTNGHYEFVWFSINGYVDAIEELAKIAPEHAKLLLVRGMSNGYSVEARSDDYSTSGMFTHITVRLWVSEPIEGDATLGVA